MDIPEKIISRLEESAVDYERIPHPRAYTAQRLAAVEHVKGRNHAKVVMVKTSKGLLMTVLPSDRRVDLERLADIEGDDVELAKEEEFAPLFPDCDLAALPPFGDLYGLPVLMDESFKEGDLVVFEAGTPHDAIKLDHDDFIHLMKPRFGAFTEKLN